MNSLTEEELKIHANELLGKMRVNAMGLDINIVMTAAIGLFNQCIHQLNIEEHMQAIIESHGSLVNQHRERYLQALDNPDKSKMH